MENKRSYLIPLMISVSLAVGLMMGSLLTPKSAVVASNEEQARYQKLQDILQILDKKYVDSVNGEDLFEKTIGDMLHRLDPHSNYIAAKDLKQINEDIQGKFGGVGVRFFIIRDTVCVTNVLPDSPSMRAGLQSGDKILEVDDELIAGKEVTNDKVMSLLKGQEGKDVELRIWRNGKKLDKTVTRGSIPVQSVTAAYMIDKTIGYVKIERFSVETAQEFRRAAYDLKQKGMKKIILDLRNNGGGVLTGATEIADEFLHANLPILETRGRTVGRQVYNSTANGMLKDVEVAILINSYSASASEILAGAIQDNDRGIIIGRRSFGKGLVQEDVQLRDGSNLRLTIARYYTPTGRCIQKPYTDNIEDYYEDQMERYDNGEMYEVDSSYFVDSLKYTTPKGKVVYGGGGIMPDIFVPLDSTGSSWYLTALRVTPAFTTFAFDYVQNKRNKWSSPSEFFGSFKVTEAVLKKFIDHAKKEHGVSLIQGDFIRSKKKITRMIKSEIARQLWVEEGFYEVNNHTDNEVQEALKALR